MYKSSIQSSFYVILLKMPKKILKNKNTMKKLSGKGDYKLSSMRASVDKAVKSKVGKEIAAIARPLVKKALMSGGAGMGGYVGGSKGRQVGSYIGSKLSKLVGSGDYEVSEPTSTNSLFPKSGMKQTTALASFGNNKDGVRMKHREFIGDLKAGVQNSFSVTPFPLNPGLVQVFPFLAAIANNFEEYQFHGLVFEFVTNTSPYSTVSNMGSIVMAAQYDAYNTPYVSKLQMENSDYAVSSIPHRNMMYGFECANHVQPYYYVRSGTVSQPINLTDIGTFYVGVQNTTAFAEGSVLGELWITYDVELLRPRLVPSLVPQVPNRMHWSGYQVTAGTSAFTPKFSDPPSTLNQVFRKSGAIFATVNAYEVTSGMSFEFPGISKNEAYRLLVYAYLSTNTSAAVAIPAVTTSGFNILNLLTTSTFNGDYSFGRGMTASTNTALINQTYYSNGFQNSTNPFPNLQISFTTLTTSAKYSFDIMLEYLSSDYTSLL
jgi:hypothetical protein